MIAPAPTREIVKQLAAAGFTKRDGKGSHTTWTCAHDRYNVSVPTGHRTISPGVRRQIDTAISRCDTDCKED
jgi:predicted RNA binding protein YcfA (HicA-like mRNA interferase family)